MKPNIGMSDANRDGVVKLLAPLLADEYVLYTKTRNYHWNVVGRSSMTCTSSSRRSTGSWTVSWTRSPSASVSLAPSHPARWPSSPRPRASRSTPGQYPDAKGMLSALSADHEAVIQTLRGDLATAMDKFSDAGTCDFLTGLMEKHEKMARMLRAFVQP